jgi:hypothetical protein
MSGVSRTTVPASVDSCAPEVIDALPRLEGIAAIIEETA